MGSIRRPRQPTKIRVLRNTTAGSTMRADGTFATRPRRDLWVAQVLETLNSVIVLRLGKGHRRRGRRHCRRRGLARDRCPCVDKTVRVAEIDVLDFRSSDSTGATRRSRRSDWPHRLEFAPRGAEQAKKPQSSALQDRLQGNSGSLRTTFRCSLFWPESHPWSSSSATRDTFVF
jgi:hypothetical protein